MKIAFACIVRGADDEAPLLDNLLDSVHKHVDGIFVTITQPNNAVKAVAEKYGANISNFDWVGDFSAARNFNFAQVPKDYDYIMWGDADDTFEGMEHIKEDMETVTADAYLMWYLYDFDKYGMATVVHAKTMVVRNDGTFTWKGRIHEDIDCAREIEVFMLDDVKRIHHPTEERVNRSAERNLGIALTEDEEDPRTWWNRSNGFMSTNQPIQALECLNTFMHVSQSESEKYLAAIYMSRISDSIDDRKNALEHARQAIAMRFDWPDAYFQLGDILMKEHKYYEARDAILEGLKKKPPIYSMIVYNPRDYDFNPLMLLGKCYWEMGRPVDALTCLKSCQEIQPENEVLAKMVDTAQEEADLYNLAVKLKEKAGKLTPKKAMKLIDGQPEKLRSHPIIMQWYNQAFIKTESSGKDVVYFCGMSHEEWGPESIEKGIGGSEEAVILLTKEWAKLGYNVTVYTNCTPGERDGVQWQPWWLYNPRNKTDITILWRSPKVLDYDINTTKLYLDLHDTIDAAELTERRIQKLDKIFVKSQAHRKLYPKVPTEKFAIAQNPVDLSLFKQGERDPFLIINTSSPERSLEACARIFRKVKEKEPRARMKWAYGWNVFDSIRKNEEKAMRWKRAITEYMDAVGIEQLGRISHKEVARLYEQAKVFLYPTRFYEIDCISARKAQIGGAHVVSSDFAALNETVEFGTKIHTTAPERVDIELSDVPENDDKYVEAVLRAFEKDNAFTDGSRWSPGSIAAKWVEVWES